MRVWLRTFGCRANHYDSEQVRAMLESSGHEIADRPDGADVAVLNSCAVTADAEADLRQAVRSAARRSPGVRTVIMGCAAALPGAQERLGILPGVSHVIGGVDLRAMAGALGVSPPARPARAQSGARAVLRIQDGCDEHCTFCATRLARGASRSRPAAELAAETRALARHHAEIVLTGTHIGSWGAETGASLGLLVERLIAAAPSVRFRLSSLEATEVDDRLAGLLRDAPAHLAPYLHAPLQSGSDAVLRRMGRHWYTASSYAAAIQRITAGRDVFGLGADVIAGFPGESEADHRVTVALVKALPFTSLHVFTYSARPDTAAPRLPGAVPPAAAHARAAELRELAAARAASYRRRRAGGTADVVVVGGAGRRRGLTEDYLEVEVDGPMPRGARFSGRLAETPDGLVATAQRIPNAESYALRVTHHAPHDA